MKNALSTITLGGTITIVVFVILLCIGLAVLFCYLTFRERKRYKAGKVRLGIKLLPLEKMIKDKLVSSRADSKFCITAVEIDNVSALKTDGGSKSVKEITEAIASRIVKEYRYPISAARQGKSRIVYLSKSAADKKLLGIVGRIQNALSVPFVGADGSEINLKCNIGVLKFPQCGNEYIKILRNIELALADAARKGGVSVASASDGADGTELNEYLKIKRAVDSGEIMLNYAAFVNAFNKERVGFSALYGGSENLLSETGGGAAGWLDKWRIGEVCRLIDRLEDKLALPIIVPIECGIENNEKIISEIIGEIKKKKEYSEQIIICFKESELFALTEKQHDEIQEISAAIDVDSAENIERYETAISRLKPRYALIDAHKFNTEELENAEKIMERYNVITIMTNVDAKSEFKAAKANGIELLMGNLYGTVLTAAEIADSLAY